MNSVKTGDILLFQSNTPTAFILRTFTSSHWNHAGAAVRIKTDGTVSLDETGLLFVLELNSGKRYDIISQTEMTGLTLTGIQYVVGKYNTISVRRMRDHLRTVEFGAAVAKFITKHHGHDFSDSFLPFISVWLGIPFAGDKRRNEQGKRELFCSEMLAYFYDNCAGPIEAQRTKKPYKENDFRLLFGPEAPEIACLYKPGHYSLELTPECPLFESSEKIIYKVYADVGVVIVQPLLLVLLALVILAMVLPRN